MNGSGLTVQIQVDNDVATDTVSGGIFRPYRCRGRDPAICRTGPVYQGGGLLCARGILTGDVGMRNSCDSVVRRTTIKNDIHEIVDGTYLVMTAGEKYSLLCEGAPEKRQELTSGLYVVTIASNCKIMGSNWVIEGLRQLNSSVDMMFRNVPIPQINLTEKVQKGKLWPKLTLPGWDKFHGVQKMQLRELTALDDTGIDVINTWEPKASDVTWSGVGTSIIIAVGLITLIACLIKLSIITIPKCPICVRRFRNESVEMSECADTRLKMSPGVTDAYDAYVRRLYPTISEDLRKSLVVELNAADNRSAPRVNE